MKINFQGVLQENFAEFYNIFFTQFYKKITTVRAGAEAD